MHLSLWLLPPSPLCEQLQKNIAHLAEHYDGSAPFEPHVTIIGGKTMPCESPQDIQDLINRLTDGLEGIGGIPCRFHKELVSVIRPDSTLVWNQACVSVMERSDEFMELIERSRRLLGIEEDQWDFPAPLGEPHYSHYYGERLLPSDADVIIPPDFVAEEAALCVTSGGLAGVGNWRALGKIRLSKRAGKSTQRE